MKNVLILSVIFLTGGILTGVSANAQQVNLRTLQLIPNRDYNPATMPNPYRQAIRYGDKWWEDILNTRKRKNLRIAVRSGDLSTAFPGFENGLFRGPTNILIWHKSRRTTLTVGHEIGHAFLGPHSNETIVDGRGGRSRWRMGDGQLNRLVSTGFLTSRKRTRLRRRFRNNAQIVPIRGANINGSLVANTVNPATD